MSDEDKARWLCDHIDQRLAKTIGDCRSVCALPRDTFDGTVTGFLIKTGIRSMVDRHMPELVIRETLERILKEALGP